MLVTLAVITATVVGLMVGVEFAVAVFIGPILRRLPVGSWIEASADGARVLGRVMPFWYIGCLLLTAWLAAAKWGGPAASLLWVLISLGHFSSIWPADGRRDQTSVPVVAPNEVFMIWLYSSASFIATPVPSATLAAALHSTSGGVLALASYEFPFPVLSEQASSLLHPRVGVRSWDWLVT